MKYKLYNAQAKHKIRRDVEKLIKKEANQKYKKIEGIMNIQATSNCL